MGIVNDKIEIIVKEIANGPKTFEEISNTSPGKQIAEYALFVLLNLAVAKKYIYIKQDKYFIYGSTLKKLNIKNENDANEHS